MFSPRERSIYYKCIIIYQLLPRFKILSYIYYIYILIDCLFDSEEEVNGLPPDNNSFDDDSDADPDFIPFDE